MSEELFKSVCAKPDPWIHLASTLFADHPDPIQSLISNMDKISFDYRQATQHANQALIVKKKIDESVQDQIERELRSGKTIICLDTLCVKSIRDDEFEMCKELMQDQGYTYHSSAKAYNVRMFTRD